MTLYLGPEITPEEIRKAAKAGIRGELLRSLSVVRADTEGVKSYPRGVTTNSSGGIEDYGVYYPVFKAMEEEGMVLNLHGEVPSDPEKVSQSYTVADQDQNISVLNAEKLFLTHLLKLSADFPKLRIVLEHATTAEAIECVSYVDLYLGTKLNAPQVTSLPSNVACTITAHHLSLTIDSVVGQPYHFCKPVAKEPKDRKALQSAVLSGNPKFFLGSDSAPHPSSSKTSTIQESSEPTSCAAGVYTSPFLVPLVAHLLESFGALDKLEGFISSNGRKFYGVEAKSGSGDVKLRRTTEESASVPGVIRGDGVEVVPFWAGKQLGWEIV